MELNNNSSFVLRSGIPNALQGEPTDQCGICFGDFTETSPAYSHLSGETHIYHLFCINTWLKDHAACPTCRIEVTHINGRSLEEHAQFLANQKLIFANGVENGVLEDVKTSLQNGSFSAEERGVAILRATRKGLVEIAGAIFEYGPILPRHFTKGFTLAASTNAQILNIFFQNGQVSHDTRSKALTRAVEHGRLDSMQALLQGTPELVQYATFTETVRFGKLEMMNFMLRTVKLRQVDRGNAAFEATIHGHIQVLEALLLNGPLSNIDLFAATKKAVENGDFQIMRALLRNGSISDEQRGQVVIIAAEKGSLEIVKVLIQNGRIPRAHHSEAIRTAEKFMHYPIVLALRNARDCSIM